MFLHTVLSNINVFSRRPIEYVFARGSIENNFFAHSPIEYNFFLYTFLSNINFFVHGHTEYEFLAYRI